MAATTQVRYDTYWDDITTLCKSKWEIKGSTWTKIYSTLDYDYLWIEPSTITATGFSVVSQSTFPVILSLDDYNRLVINEVRSRMFDVITDNTVEYMIWPDTFTAPANWPGWCLQKGAVRNYPVECPGK